MMYDSRISNVSTSAPSRRSALRAFGWHELTARINAARELRQELLQDSCVLTASFGDAAAGYFAAGDQGKRVINPNALEAGKACEGIDITDRCDVSARDAREIDD